MTTRKSTKLKTKIYTMKKMKLKVKEIEIENDRKYKMKLQNEIGKWNYKLKLQNWCVWQVTYKCVASGKISWNDKLWEIWLPNTWKFKLKLKEKMKQNNLQPRRQIMKQAWHKLPTEQIIKTDNIANWLVNWNH